MSAWHVYLYGIQWDDGKGEYDVSELPENLRVTIHTDDADNKQDAIELALEEATDSFGSLVAGTEQISVTFVA